MDKYEYKVKTEQMLEYMEKKQYKQAAEVADTIDWKRVKNVSMLNNVSEIYENAGELSKSREILYIAYDRAPGSKKIMYRLAVLAIRVEDIAEAVDCYESFVNLAPKDPNRYVLKYRIQKAQNASVADQITTLEDLKKAEYVEKWAYELATLYDQAGMTSKCIEECDDLILWFSEGKYVYKAMELKQTHKPLTPLQQEKYDQRPVAQSKKLTAETIVMPSIGSKSEEKVAVAAEVPEAEEVQEPTPEETESAKVAAEAFENENVGVTKTMFTGENLQDALKKGVLHASGIAMTNEEDAPEEQQTDEELLLSGKMKIDELLADWEAKQKEVEKAIQAQKEIDEVRIEKERKESEARLAAEHERLQREAEAEKQRKLEEERLAQEQKERETVAQIMADEEEDEFADFEFAETEAEEEIEDEVEEENPVAEEVGEDDYEEDDADYEDDEAVVDPEELVASVYMEEEFDNAQVMAPEEIGFDDDEDDEYEVDDKYEVDDEYEVDEESEADEDELEEDDFEEAELDEDDFDEADDEDFDDDFNEDFGEFEVVSEDEDELAEVEELDDDEDFDADFDDDFDDSDFDDADFADDFGDVLDEIDDDFGLEPALDVAEVEDDFEDDDFDDDFEDDFEDELDDDFDDDDLDEEAETEVPEDDDDEEFDLHKALEESIEPTEEEIQRRIKKSKGGVPFDTGFVVTGRYDLSATSEIGLKAGLTEEQKKLFSYFVPVRGMSEQIVEVLDNDRRTQKEGTSKVGNILVIGRKGSGKTVLAVDIVKAIQKQRNLKQGKIAIVTGESLNKKELTTIFKKLRGGAIIIEKAGKLNSRTIKELNMLMDKPTGEILFVLEDQRKPLERIFTAHPQFKKKFSSRLELPVFINDELVTFGQTYAKENGYKLDEMSILALYSRVDAMQRDDHSVTVAEVKEIMDEAIAHSQKANVKHLARRVFGKSTDASDRVILKEEDFRV